MKTPSLTFWIDRESVEVTRDQFKQPVTVIRSIGGQ